MSIIRRFDTDGDAKINESEFIEGLRSAIFIKTHGGPSYQMSSSKNSGKVSHI